MLIAAKLSTCLQSIEKKKQWRVPNYVKYKTSIPSSHQIKLRYYSCSRWRFLMTVAQLVVTVAQLLMTVAKLFVTVACFLMAVAKLFVTVAPLLLSIGTLLCCTALRNILQDARFARFSAGALAGSCRTAGGVLLQCFVQTFSGSCCRFICYGGGGRTCGFVDWFGGSGGFRKATGGPAASWEGIISFAYRERIFFLLQTFREALQGSSTLLSDTVGLIRQCWVLGWLTAWLPTNVARYQRSIWTLKNFVAHLNFYMYYTNIILKILKINHSI